MADGEGLGPVKPLTVQCGGRVCSKERRQLSVMKEEEFGFTKRMCICLVDVPVIEGRVVMVVCIVVAAKCYGNFWRAFN